MPAKQVYYEPARPLVAAATAQSRPERDLLDIEDVSGKRVISTRYSHAVTVHAENATAALEVMSRFAIHPRWLIYLPPTMSPTATAPEGPLLDRPSEAFEYYQTHGVSEVVCEEKHMGSRAVVVVCRDLTTAARRFGSVDQRRGVIYTRTGRPFFSDEAIEAQLLERVANALEQSGLWDELAADWGCLDVELLPWSAKAQELLQTQYAAVGASARSSLSAAVQFLGRASTRDPGANALHERFQAKLSMAEAFTNAYRRYCWPVNSIADLKLAPFHVLAAGSGTCFERDHLWHMTTLAKLAHVDPGLFRATQHRIVDLTSTASQAEGSAWWHELTARGGEGMVVKPRDFVARGKRGLLQPAVKCRGQEYLRIIYGPEYDAEGNLERLRARGLGRKRALALQEFALGLEGLQRFVDNEPLHRVHECVFGVLALESEPVDPRL